VKAPRPKESIGIQDRLTQIISSRTDSRRRTPVRRATQVRIQGQVVGSGLQRVSAEQDNQFVEQEAFDYADADQELESGQDEYVEPISGAVVEVEEFELELPSVPSISDDVAMDRSVRSNRSRNAVRAATVQDGEAAPVRHAFAPEQYRRIQEPVAVQLDESPTTEPFDHAVEWSDEATIASQPQRADGPQPRTPARSTSILSRQDEDQANTGFRPQPTLEQDSQRSKGFREEIDRLDRQFKDRSLGTPKTPEQLPEQTDRPRSLLELDSGVADEDPRSDDQDGNDDENSKTSLLDQSCAEFRTNMFKTSIRDIALDISPPAINADKNSMGVSRNWTDRQGQVIASGTMVDMKRGYVFLDNGQKISFARLSEPDLVAVSEHWNIPRSCLVSSTGTAERCWQPQSYQWTASSLCHKPLYFENIQLERYGHSHGPIRQPVVSVAHFFVSLATLPYQTAIHPLNECEYALGLYRPGDCAPWLKDPIPISLDGLKRQALVTTGLAFIP
jgi:hypothetical protein